MTTCHGIDQGIKGCLQSWIDLGRPLATPSGNADPSNDRYIGVRPAMLQIAYTHSNCIASQSRGGGHCRDTTPAQIAGFGGGPLSPHPLVHHRGQGNELFSDPFRRGRVSHALTMRN